VSLILVIILIVLLLGAGGYGYRSGWGGYSVLPWLLAAFLIFALVDGRL
jgi:hypothetical protein